jgi:hypothetical protein
MIWPCGSVQSLAWLGLDALLWLWVMLDRRLTTRHGVLAAAVLFLAGNLLRRSRIGTERYLNSPRLNESDITLCQTVNVRN